jgi:hypothetical protein
VPATPEPTHLRVGGWTRFDIWAEHATEKQRDEAYALLFALCEGSHEDRHSASLDDIADGTIRHSLMEDDEILSWRVTPDYPGTLQIIYVGPIDLF